MGQWAKDGLFISPEKRLGQKWPSLFCCFSVLNTEKEGDMAEKRESGVEVQDFEFALSHADIRDMMNDPNVLLNGGNILSSQDFKMVLRKTNGVEVGLRTIKNTDKIVFRFSKTVETVNDTQYTDVDIS